MNQIIYKYVFKNDRFPTFDIPIGSYILSAKNIDDDICVWALCNRDEKELIGVNFFVAYTGEPKGFSTLTHDLIFVDTVLINDGKIVCHVFMEPTEGITKI